MSNDTGSQPGPGATPQDGPVPATVRSFFNEPIMIAAFTGWNDAANAATAAIGHVAEVFSADLVSEIDADEYVDFQVNRPLITLDEAGTRHINWPNTQFYVAHSWLHNRRIIFVQGVEPSLKWKSYCAQILRIGQELGAKSLICLGALLADEPHTRPLSVSVTSSHRDLAAEFGISASAYEGPAGIVSILSNTAELDSMPVVSAWGTVPHYVSAPPSPKATASLVTVLETLLGEPIDRFELDEDSRVWQSKIDVLAAADPEIAAYVKELEQKVDTTAMPAASGEAIAKELERFLRRREGDATQ